MLPYKLKSDAKRVRGLVESPCKKFQENTKYFIQKNATTVLYTSYVVHRNSKLLRWYE